MKICEGICSEHFKFLAKGSMKKANVEPRKGATEAMDDSLFTFGEKRRKEKRRRD
jgi:hypothetical protein